MFLDSDKIRLLRAERGYTQAQLAELTDLSTRTIQRVERDGVASQETTSALAAVLEINRTDLFLTDQPNKPPENSHLVGIAIISALSGLGVGIATTLIFFH